jgi:hypothetical protein
MHKMPPQVDSSLGRASNDLPEMQVTVLGQTKGEESQVTSMSDSRSVSTEDVLEQLDVLNGVLKHVLTHGHMTTVELGNIVKMASYERNKAK